jgi:hypothetical protein
MGNLKIDNNHLEEISLSFSCLSYLKWELEHACKKCHLIGPETKRVIDICDELYMLMKDDDLVSVTEVLGNFKLLRRVLAAVLAEGGLLKDGSWEVPLAAVESAMSREIRMTEDHLGGM